ncbi:hypothetical protein ACNKU7_15215 [Microbulbifer sp. SA54]|uniref:hypothetical protein n=1 Tax=Microbulbifer sp. SA54 TaxID=3401577 RepID=UPI003AAC9505
MTSLAAPNARAEFMQTPLCHHPRKARFLPTAPAVKIFPAISISYEISMEPRFTNETGEVFFWKQFGANSEERNSILVTNFARRRTSRCFTGRKIHTIARED